MKNFLVYVLDVYGSMKLPMWGEKNPPNDHRSQTSKNLMVTAQLVQVNSLKPPVSLFSLNLGHQAAQMGQTFVKKEMK